MLRTLFGLCFLCTISLFSFEKPILYTVSKDEQVAYLFGTIPTKDSRLLALPDSVYNAFLASDVLVTEITFDSWDSFSALPKIFLPDGEELRSRLSDETWTKLEEVFSQVDFPFTLHDMRNRQVWYVMSEISDKVNDKKMKERGETAVEQDLFFQTAAREMGKNVGGLQTPTEKIDIMLTFSSTEHEYFLASLLDEILSEDDHDTAFVDWYLRGGEPEKFEEFFHAEGEKESQFAQSFLQKMFYEPSSELANLMIERMSADPEKIHFFALNVGLLLGETNTIQTLQKKGYLVEISN